MVIEVIPSTKDPELKYTKQVIELLSGQDCLILMDKEYREVFSERENICFGASVDPDFCIVLGGDGTIMRAAQKASALGVPMVGVNLGRIGYLAEIEVDEIPLLSALFDGEYYYEDRMMLDATVYRDGKAITEPICGLNDAICTHGFAPIITDFELYSGGLPVSRYRADGIIIATPTGSTAYAMASGGPILDTHISAFCAVPICPHTLYAKPIIFDSDTVLQVRNHCDNEGDFVLTVDGNQPLALMPGDTVSITKSKRITRLVRLNCKRRHHGFYGTLQRKMKEF